MRTPCSVTIMSLLGLATVALLSDPAEAVSMALGASSQAWYRDRDGLNIKFFSEPATESVYRAFVGSYDDPDFGLFHYHSYFIFDVGDVTAPVQSATLRLPIKQYFSSKTTEEIAVFDVEASADNLLNTPFSLENYEDLGSGIEYGRQALSIDQPLANDDDTILLSFIDVTLSDMAVQAINQAIERTEQFAVGVSLASLDNSPYVFDTGIEATEGISFADGVREYPRFEERADELAAYEFPAELIFDRVDSKEPTAIPESSSVIGIGLLGIGFVIARSLKRSC